MQGPSEKILENSDGTVNSARPMDGLGKFLLYDV